MRNLHRAVWRLVLWVLLSVDARDTAQRWLTAMGRRFPGDVHVLITEAHLLAQRAEWAAASEHLRAALHLRPEHAAAWFNLAFVLEQQGQWDGARAAFEQALVIEPGLDRAWYGLGLVLIRLGRLEEAARALQRNTELQPMSPYGWYQLARVRFDLHDHQAATTIFHHLRSFEPTFAAQLERELAALTSGPGRSTTADNPG